MHPPYPWPPPPPRTKLVTLATYRGHETMRVPDEDDVRRYERELGRWRAKVAAIKADERRERMRAIRQAVVVSASGIAAAALWALLAV